MEAMNTSDQVADNDALSDTYDELHDYDYPNLYYCSALPPAEAIYSDVENEDGSAIKDDSLPTMQTGYDTLDPSTRELPPVPVPYDELTKPEYVNTGIAATEVTSHEEPTNDADIPSDVSGSTTNADPLSTMQTGAYSTLDPSTREPTPVPVPYDELTTPEYVNTDIAATEVAGHEEQPSNADVTSDVSSSSAPTHSQPESFVTRELPPPPAETD